MISCSSIECEELVYFLEELIKDKKKLITVVPSFLERGMLLQIKVTHYRVYYTMET